MNPDKAKLKRIKNPKKGKTQYCSYYAQCDRDEDCKGGEYCPVFKFNSQRARKDV